MPRKAQPPTDTKFMIGIKEKLIANELAEGTAKLYITKLKKLNKNKDFTSLSFLKDTKYIKSLIDGLGNKNTKKSYITSVVSVLNVINTKPYNQTNTFYKAMLNEQKDYFNTLDPHEKTETQKENWVDWEEVLKIHKELETEALSATPDELAKSKQAKQTLHDYTLLSLYVMTPPRRNADYYLMKLDTDKKTNDDYNYYSSAEGKFYFNKFKTAKYGKENFMVSSGLKKVLDRYIELMDIKDDQFILFPTDTKRTSGSAMTKALNRIFGKKVGASMLRHSYLTSKYGKVTDEMAKDAELMAHSVSQQSDYIKE
jgi:hypothetical protein